VSILRLLRVSSLFTYDSCVDLSQPGEIVYRDKGYQGAEPRGYNASMRRGRGIIRWVSGIG